MQVWESRFFNFLPEIIQCFPCSLRISSEALHQLVNTENRENGLAVNLKIIRLLEILIDHPVNDNLKIIFINNSVPQNRRIVLIFVNIPIIALYIVIGPHDIKLHLRVIFCFQESIVQRTFQKWPLVIPVPVIHKDIDSMFHCQVNPFLNHLRVVIHLITTQRKPRLVMAFKSWVSFLDHLPFPGSFGPQHITETLVVMARWPNVGCNVIL